MIRKIITVIIVLTIILSPSVYADDWYSNDDGYFSVTDEHGEILFLIASAVTIGDEYISSDNKRYEIVEVDRNELRAAARFIENVDLNSKSNDISYNILQNANNSLLVPQQIAKKTNKTVALYCTHSDESYVPTDGVESEPEEGGILDVSRELANALQELGCEVNISYTPHEPHDAGAYRRSRQTAVGLMKESQPAILADIHRDAVPPEVYEEEIDGVEVSKVRMVVGATNQNKAANEDFAKEIKSIADEKYPGLIKDIYIGKGNYNQDLMPQAILFEFGTHTIKKERAQESAKMIADVIATSLGITTQKKEEDNEKKDTKTQPNEEDTPKQDNNSDQSQPDNVEQQSANKPAGESNSSGIWKSILLTLGVITAVGVTLLFVFNSSGERGDKFKSFWHELTGIGKNHRK